MSQVFFISDLHLGHKSILKFSPDRVGTCSCIYEHDEILVDRWNSKVNKRDTVWVLGDICFDIEKMPLFDRMLGTKNLIIGNHDKFQLGVYQKYFNKIHGFLKYKGFWISHAPIHPDELRGKRNIHGHVHSNIITDLNGKPDDRYISVCVEACHGYPIPFNQIRNRYN